MNNCHFFAMIENEDLCLFLSVSFIRINDFFLDLTKINYLKSLSTNLRCFGRQGQFGGQKKKGKCERGLGSFLMGNLGTAQCSQLKKVFHFLFQE